MKYEIYEKNDDEVDEDDLYKLDKIILDEKNDVSVPLKSNSKIYMI